jgi:hypothetical protein
MLTTILLNLIPLLAINIGGIVVTILFILIVIAILIGVFALFEKFVTTIGQPIKGVIIFIVLALLIIYAITNGGVIF